MGRSSGVTLALVLVAAGAGAQEGDHPPIPIQFSLPEAGFVTLVIDDQRLRIFGFPCRITVKCTVPEDITRIPETIKIAADRQNRIMAGSDA